MARSNYSLIFPGKVDYTNSRGDPPPVTFNAISQRISETSSGVARRKPSGWMPPTGYSFFYRNVQYAQGVCLSMPGGVPSALGSKYVGCVGDSNGRFNSDSHYNSTYGESSVVDESLFNRALIKARLALKSSDVNLGVAFAERNRTAVLIGGTAKRIARSFSHLKRGQTRKAMQELGIVNTSREPRGNNIPNKWLEMQYGWKPLLSDIYGACAALSKQPKENWRVTAKGTVTDKREVRRTFTSHDAGICTVEVDNSCYCRIDALPQNETKISLASLGITNPLVIAWELLPYSFVVDWFLPVGDYLFSLDALLGYSSAYTSNSLLTKAKWVDVGIRMDIGFGSIVDNKYYGQKEIRSLQRIALAGVPLPTFPSIKDPRSLGHMANGLALLSQAFSRRS